ncbi:MAG: hypothetical protein SFX18_15505 [Pirellulales bacterium]|nr:hypothetical protein [Pirellulales bacterium]
MSMFEFELQHRTRNCFATGQELAAGETYFTVLLRQGAQIERRDYSVAGWNGPPTECVAWWKAQVPLPTATTKPRWAPNEVLLKFFEDLAGRPEQADLRYVLTLLLIRRRLLRLESSERDAQGIERLRVHCPRLDCEFEILAIVPEDSRVTEIQRELGRLFLSVADDLP